MTTPPARQTEQPDDELVRATERDRLPVRDVWIDGKLVEMPIDPAPPDPAK